MKGYSKIKENHPFFQRSKSKKEYPFLDKDFDKISSNSYTKKSQEHEEPTHFDDDKKNDILSEKCDDQDQLQQQKQVKNEVGEKKIGAVLRRNLTVSSTKSSSYAFAYQKNDTTTNDSTNIGNSILERQSSTRAIQEAVRRAFSMRRSSSVNNSDRYCRIYDQPVDTQDCDNYDYVYDHDDGNHNIHQDDGFERINGSTETRSMNMKKKSKDNNGKMKLGSKVVKACKCLFSR